jgi:hypothetical protein
MVHFGRLKWAVSGGPFHCRERKFGILYLGKVSKIFTFYPISHGIFFRPSHAWFSTRNFWNPSNCLESVNSQIYMLYVIYKQLLQHLKYLHIFFCFLQQNLCGNSIFFELLKPSLTMYIFIIWNMCKQKINHKYSTPPVSDTSLWTLWTYQPKQWNFL